MDDKINQAINALADEKIADAKATKGETCPKCGVIQGRPFYCKHTIECIDLKYKDEFARIVRMAHNRN